MVHDPIGEQRAVSMGISGRSTDAGNEVDHLRSLVATLAAEPQEQLEYVDNLGVAPDELALELYDLALRLPVLVREKRIGPVEAQAVLMIDTKFRDMSGEDRADLWTREALAASETWEEIRGLATAALQLLQAADSLAKE